MERALIAVFLTLFLALFLPACANETSETPQCVDVIEIDAMWTVQDDGGVAYESCFDCDEVNVCVVLDCCPPGWVFLAPGQDKATVLCELEL